MRQKTKRNSKCRKEQGEIIELIVDPYYECDLAGNFTFVNDAACDAFGLAREDFLGTSFRDLMEPDKSEETYEVFHNIYLTGRPVRRQEWTARLRDGRELVFELSASLMRDTDGRVVGFRGICRDTTDRKKTEEALKEAHDKLEERVTERTAELVASNRLLTKEIIERMNVERALRESQERLKLLYTESKRGEDLYLSLLNSSVDAVTVYDMEGRTQYVNPAFTRIFGWTKEDVHGKLIDFVPDSEREHTMASVRRTIEDGIPVSGFETRRFTKDGRLVDVSLSASLYHDHEGNPAGMLVMHRDITEQKQAEEALRDSEERYRSVMEAAPDPIVVYDMEGMVCYLNPAFTRVFGWTLEDLVNQKPDYVPEECVAETERMIQAVLRGESFYGIEATRYTKDGELVDVSLSAAVFRDRFGAPKGSVVCLQDVTQRKRAEEALRRSEERFRAVFEGAQDLIYIKDVSLRYTHVNPAMESILELNATELVGKTDERIFGKEAGSHIREVERRVLAGQSIEQEHTRTINGAPFTFLDIRVPLRNPEGDVVGVCGISRNITERKKTRQPVKMSTDAYPSEAMRATLQKASYAAATDSIVLLLGESGTGKDFLARWIHDHSRRANGSFFSLNCAALPQELAEAELFGHEAGAFTGARGRKRGLLELAEGGTLLLNEIGELSPTLQSKLLSFLDTRSFVRVRGEKSIHVDARLMAATHRDLKREVEEGQFLKPLFYRLNVFAIELPLLTERLEDIPLIVDQIMTQLASEMHLQEIPTIDPVTLRSLQNYRWPGNVRELRNVVERALMISHRGTLRLELPRLSAPPKDWSYEVRFPSGSTLHEVVDSLTHSLLVEALRRTQGNKKEAARRLGISRKSVHRYVDRYGLEGQSVPHKIISARD